jgi:hypothetical protein
MLIPLQPNRYIDHSEIKHIYLDLYGLKKIPCIRIETNNKKAIVLTDFESFEDIEGSFNKIVSLVNEWNVYIIKESRKVVKDSKVTNKLNLKGSSN